MKQIRSLADRLRDISTREVTPASNLSEQERARVRALAEEIGQRESSTIAKLMSGSAAGGPRSLSPEAAQRILDQVEDHPGCNVHELSRLLGEKAIFVLSRVDDLVREKLLVRLEDGRLYRSRDYGPGLQESEFEIPADEKQNHSAFQQMETSRIFIRVFHFLTQQLGLEPDCNGKMVVHRTGGKFFEMKGSKGCVNMTVYGIYKRDLVEDFKKNTQLQGGRINFSPLTGILDIRGCRYRDLENILPWVARFFNFCRQVQLERSGQPPSAI